MTQLLKEKQSDYRFNRELIDECEGNQVHTYSHEGPVNMQQSVSIVIHCCRCLRFAWALIIPVMEL